MARVRVGTSIGIHAVVIIVSLLMVLPFLIMAGNSFKLDTEIARRPLSIIPQEPTLHNFRVLFDRIPFWRQFVNSTMVATISTLSAAFVSALVAYGFARFEFRGKRAVFLVVLATILIPPQVLIVPQFRMFVAFRWINTYWPLLLPTMVNGFFIYLIHQIMLGIPKDLFESAMIDGASEFRIFRVVAIPLAQAGLSIVTVLRFMASWNEFFAPLLYLNDQQLLTLPVGLATLKGFTEITLGIPMAGALLSSVPILILLGTVGNKYFVQGITAGALKG